MQASFIAMNSEYFTFRVPTNAIRKEITPYKAVCESSNKLLIIFITVKAETEQCFFIALLPPQL
jgi:hypothetical protein